MISNFPTTHTYCLLPEKKLFGAKLSLKLMNINYGTKKTGILKLLIDQPCKIDRYSSGTLAVKHIVGHFYTLSRSDDRKEKIYKYRGLSIKLI